MASIKICCGWIFKLKLQPVSIYKWHSCCLSRFKLKSWKRSILSSTSKLFYDSDSIGFVKFHHLGRVFLKLNIAQTKLLKCKKSITHADALWADIIMV